MIRFVIRFRELNVLDDYDTLDAANDRARFYRSRGISCWVEAQSVDEEEVTL